ncbi:hypothetical protein K8R32_00010 [bacterium]|nr:hypothetical protein [bacterium]
MFNKKFIGKLKKDFDLNVGERRQIISLANVVLHDSKRVIFALHRNETKKAEQQLASIEEVLKKLEKKFGFTRLYQEGSYKAGAEEYVEARTFFEVINGRKLDIIKDITIAYDTYLGGICDLTGELVRRAVNEAAAGREKEVKKIKDIINTILAELVEFDMTSYLRTKYDQAKRNLRKIEQMDYEIKLRR